MESRAGHDSTDCQQQECLTNVESEFVGARRQTERMRNKADVKQAAKRTTMSNGAVGVKRDKGKQLEMKEGRQ